MDRGTSVNYTGALSFTYATTGPDLFKMTDVQQLAQAVELHTHDAVGKGLGVAGTAIKTAIDMPDWFRSTGHTSAYATAGQGAEMYYEPSSGGIAVFQGYNRGGSIFMPTRLQGSTVGLFANGTEAIHVAADATVVFGAAVTCNSTLAVGGATNVTGTITCNGIVCTTLSASSNVSITGSLSVGANGITVSDGGIICHPWLQADTLYVTGAGNGVLQATGAGAGLILRSTSGVAAFDGNGSGNAAVGITGTLQVSSTCTFSAGVTCAGLTSSGGINAPQYVLTGGGGQYFYPVSSSIRYAVPAGGRNSFENISGGYAPLDGASFNVSSARRLKADIVPLANPLALIQDEQLHGVSYTEIATDLPKIGFVADDWLGKVPGVVVVDELGEVQALDYDRIGAITFEALKQYVARTEARLAALENAA